MVCSVWLFCSSWLLLPLLVHSNSRHLCTISELIAHQKRTADTKYLFARTHRKKCTFGVQSRESGQRGLKHMRARNLYVRMTNELIVLSFIIYSSMLKMVTGRHTKLFSIPFGLGRFGFVSSLFSLFGCRLNDGCSKRWPVGHRFEQLRFRSTLVHIDAIACRQVNVGAEGSLRSTSSRIRRSRTTMIEERARQPIEYYRRMKSADACIWGFCIEWKWPFPSSFANRKIPINSRQLPRRSGDRETEYVARIVSHRLFSFSICTLVSAHFSSSFDSLTIFVLHIARSQSIPIRRAHTRIVSPCVCVRFA